ncbi:MAG: MgtC/SapB family protein [Dehalococcoidia bacterium]
MDAGTLELIGRIVLAAVLGAGIGLQRELARKPAGLRTHALICMGAALFTVVSFVGFGAGDADWVDTSRVAAGVVTGIGFLGAGTIIRESGGVQGLTTAACIWSIAAIGIASGAGEYILAATAAALASVILAIPKIKE